MPVLMSKSRSEHACLDNKGGQSPATTENDKMTITPWTPASKDIRLVDNRLWHGTVISEDADGKTRSRNRVAENPIRKNENSPLHKRMRVRGVSPPPIGARLGVSSAR